MADPFSLTPDFSWVDHGTDEGALVRAAAEVAAARMRQSAKPAAGRQEGAITAGLEHLGDDVYKSLARPSRIINELVGVPPGALTSGLVPRVDQAVPEVASDLMGLGSMGAPRASAGIFGGRLSKTADLEGLARAEKMAAEAENPIAARYKIHRETGWFQGADGKWRYEIPDDTAGIFGLSPDRAASSMQSVDDLSKAIISKEDRGLRYSDVLQHPEVEAAYGMGDKFASVRPMEAGTRGSLDPVYGIMSINSKLDPWEARSTALHELQHAIQRREGFATGGSPSMFKEEFQQLNAKVDEINKQMSAASKAGDLVTYHRLMDERSAMVPRINELQGKYGIVGEEPYRKLAGEVEARNVQARKDLTPEQRRASAPWTTEDVPRDQQVISGFKPDSVLGANAGVK